MVLMAVLLGALIICYILIKSYNEKQEGQQESEAESIQIASVTADEVSGLSVEWDENKLSFTKEEDTWHYDGDKDFPVNQEAMENLIGKFENVNAVRELEDPQGLEEYGLEECSEVIALTMQDGTTRTFYVGNKNAITSDYYIYVDSPEKIYTTDTGIISGCQFMLGTGKIYGLKNNSLIDERRDPVKSTWAAARYLKDLYDIYQDWNLVLAAYNCGPGTINKAIRRAGGATDYWTIYNYLPKETRGYVPAFIAANYIMTYYCEHGICPMETQLPNATDTIHINKDLHLQQVAEVCNINLDQLRSLNPQYKKDIIPGNSELCALRLPNNFVSTFIDRQDSVFAYKPNEYLTKRKTVAIKETTSSRNRSSKGTLYHKIKQGDTLGGIAAKYHVSISQLRNLNGIKGNNIRAGRSLRIR